LLNPLAKKGQIYYYCSKSRKIVDYGCFRGCLDKEYKVKSQLKAKKPIKVKSKKYQTSKKTYNVVFNRCCGMCALCLTEYDLQLHHIKGRGRYLTDNPDNCIMLCDNCHNNIVHKANKFWRPVLLQIVERQKNDPLWYIKDNEKD